jgi:hypothetical protein
MIAGSAGRPGAAGRLPAKGAGNVILEEMRDVRLEGPAHAVEEIRSRRRQGHQRQDRDRKRQVQKPRCAECHPISPDLRLDVKLRQTHALLPNT